MLGRMTTVKASAGWKKDEVAMMRRFDGAWVTAERDAAEEAEWRRRLRMLLDYSVLYELNKFNAIVFAVSIGEIKLEVAEKIYPVESRDNEPGYRLVTMEDFAA